MLQDLTSAALYSLAVIGLTRCWGIAKPLVFDRDPIEPPAPLNRRNGANSGRGRGHRCQPDPNPEKFRKFDAAVPRFTN
jgi:hypothetical protein